MKDTLTSVFTAALFIIARTWKQPKCPSVEEGIKMWCIHLYVESKKHGISQLTYKTEIQLQM